MVDKDVHRAPRWLALAALFALLVAKIAMAAVEPALPKLDWQRRASGEIDGLVTHAAAGNGQVFIAGWFSNVKDEAALGIAHWNGSRWRGLGPVVGPQLSITAMAWDGSRGRLYVAGTFTEIAGVRANGVAMWDGNRWSALRAADTPDGYVSPPGIRSLAVDPATGHLYAGGAFDAIEGRALNGVGRWDGSRWQPLGAGLDGNGYAQSLAWSPSNGRLYVSGAFGRVDGGIPAEGFAYWNGTAWTGVASVEFDLAPGHVAVHPVSGRVYLNATSTREGDFDRLAVLQWDGTTWSTVGDGRSSANGWESGGGLAIDPVHGRLYALINVDTQYTALHVWNGASWQALAGSSEDFVASVAWDATQGRLVVGGMFREIGGIAANNIAALAGGTWSAFDPGTSGRVNDVVRDPDTGDLYVGGDFTAIDGVAAARVARWEGSRWVALGPGIGTVRDDTVTALAWDRSTRRLYAAGRFALAGGVAAANIAVWDGARWQPLGAGLRADDSLSVSKLVVDPARGRLFAMGEFDDAGDAGVSNIAMWDGTRWNRLQSGLSGPVGHASLRDADGALFVTGAFSTAGGVSSSGFALWDGAAWQAMERPPGGLTATAWDTETGTLLGTQYANEFSFGQPATPLFRWSPATRQWSPLGKDVFGSPNGVMPLPGGGAVLVGALRAPYGEQRFDGARLWDGCTLRPLVAATGSQVYGATWDPSSRTLVAAGRPVGLDRAPMRVGSLSLPTDTEPSLSREATDVIAAVEDAPPVVLAPGALLCDLEGDRPSRLDVRILDAVAGESLTITQGGAIGDIGASFDGASATLSLQSPSGTATLAQWREAIRRVGYSNRAEVAAALDRTVRFEAVDSDVKSTPMDIPLRVQPFNDPPVPSGPVALQATEDVELSLQGFDFVDADNRGTIYVAFAVDRGSLQVSPSGWWSGREASLAGSVAEVRAALAAGRVLFRTDPNDTRDVTLTFTVRDQGGPGDSASGALSRTIRITPVDDAPTINANLRSAYYTEGDTPQRLGIDARVDDVDSDIAICAAVISGGGNSATDRLGSDAPNARWNAVAMRLDLAPMGGTLTPAQCSSALATVSFFTEGPLVRGGTRNLSAMAGAPGATATAQVVSILVVERDDPPTISPMQRVIEGVEDQPLLIPAFTVDEPDSARIGLRLEASGGAWSVSGDTSGLTISPSSGWISVEGEAARVVSLAARPAFTYTPSADANGDVALRVNVGTSMGAGTAATSAQWTLRLAPVPDPPQFDAVPRINGVPRPREVLTLEAYGARDPDGDAVTVRREWLRDGVPIPDATGETYVVVEADVSRRISARITASDGVLQTVAFADPRVIVDIDVIVARPDRLWVAENGPATTMAVVANDVYSSAALAGGRLAIVSSPSPGTASIVAGPLPGPADDLIRYVPAASWSGIDRLRYQLCEGGVAPRCSAADLQITVSPSIGGVGPIRLEVPTASGFRDLQGIGLRPLNNVLFTASALHAPSGWSPVTNLDTTPESPWDRSFEGTSFQVRRIAASTTPMPRHLVVEAAGFAGDVDLYVGIDGNGDGQPSALEVECAASNGVGERCDVPLAPTANLPLDYWVLVHNRASVRQTIGMSSAEIPLSAGDGSLVATAPGNAPTGASTPVRLQWNDPTLLPSERRWGAIRMIVDGVVQAVVPVEVRRTGAESTAVALQDGAARNFRIRPGEALDHAFIDVPAGATELRITTQSAASIALSAVRAPGPSSSAAQPLVPRAPSTTPEGRSDVFGGNESVVIANPAPGRWYAVVANPGSGAVALSLRATVVGTAPRVRPGGYYNPGRSGSGLFVYPAGAAWAGLWYTYLQDGTPTWYYLQETAPGVNGIWRGVLYRSAWFGTRNQLTAIGHATITPTSTSAFTLSYTLDGEVGSEAYENFGGGCPTFAGAPLNVSGHWFDPAKAGSGYSVQLFPNYEFYTVFGYDARGVPRYLIAERSGIGSATQTLNLEQNTGACPLCARTGDPVRSRIGTFTRTFASGTLQGIQLSGAYTAGVLGTWAANDVVTPLGSLQGCLAN